MPSSEIPAGATTSRGGPSRAKAWNRRLHFYLGLYFLFFVWLFALSGLLLNHSSWAMASMRLVPRSSGAEYPINQPTAGSPLEQARQLMRELDITGEIQWVAMPANANGMDFRVVRPGQQYDIKANFQEGRASVQQTHRGKWAIFQNLHTFTGVRATDPRNNRDWIATTIWAYSMDAVAVGLLVMVGSGLVMWFGLPGKRLWGWLALGSGVIICHLFVFSLRSMH